MHSIIQYEQSRLALCANPFSRAGLAWRFSKRWRFERHRAPFFPNKVYLQFSQVQFRSHQQKCRGNSVWQRIENYCAFIARTTITRERPRIGIKSSRNFQSELFVPCRFGETHCDYSASLRAVKFFRLPAELAFIPKQNVLISREEKFVPLFSSVCSVFSRSINLRRFTLSGEWKGNMSFILGINLDSLLEYSSSLLVATTITTPAMLSDPSRVVIQLHRMCN